jgi:dTDP-glucose 4,6-dehydratase
MKRVLLTGAGGAIGVHVLAHIMHNTDWFVVCTDSFKTEHKGYHDRIVRVCRDHPEWLKRMKVITHDLCAPFTDRQVNQIGKINYIINLASRSDVQNAIDDPWSFVRNNTEIMITMLQYARKAKPEVFLQFSTDEVYGPSPKNSGGHKEWDPIIPSNMYSASKAIQEAMCTAEWRSENLRLITTNTMNNFGEMQAPSKFPAMIQQKIEKGETIIQETRPMPLCSFLRT